MFFLLLTDFVSGWTQNPNFITWTILHCSLLNVFIWKYTFIKEKNNEEFPFVLWWAGPRFLEFYDRCTVLVTGKRRANLGGKEALFWNFSEICSDLFLHRGLVWNCTPYHLQETCVNIYMWYLHLHQESHLHGDVVSIIYIKLER